MSEKHQEILNLILDEGEITWQSILYDLIKTEQMDPWDVDVSLLTKKYIQQIKMLKEHDFRVSGKVVLAAAILLKIKSKRWIEEDIANLDALFTSAEEEEFLDFEEDFIPREKVDAELIPRTPQPRKRKVSVYDLVNALEKALEVKHRRVLRQMPVLDVKPPKKKKDISLVMKEVYGNIKKFFKEKTTHLTFSKLSPSQSKEDKLETFVPLLHLTNQRKIDLHQHQPFGEIEITVHEEG